MPFVAEQPASPSSAGQFVPDAKVGGFVPDPVAPPKEPDSVYTFENLKRGLGIVADRYAPTALKVHEANAPSPFLEQIMPRIDAPDVSIPIPGSPINFNPSIAVAPINALSSIVKGLSNPEMAPIATGMGAVSAAGRLVPAASRLAQIAEVPVQAYFAGDMTKGAMEGAKRTGELAADPNATLGRVIESGLETTASAAMGAVAGIGAVRGLSTRLAGKTPEQASKAIREEAKITEDKAAANALTDAADAIDREIAARDAQVKAQADAQKLAEQQAKEAERVAKEQQKAQAEAQKAAQEALQPPEVPKSAQILAEPAKTPSIANVATEVATQTENSPFALQNKLNELTAVPSPLPEATPMPAGRVQDVSQPSKSSAIKTAVSNPDTVWQYTVSRKSDAGFDHVQVDALEGGTNTVSSNPKDLRRAGADIPDVPAWVPQGKYSLEEINQFIKQGEPKNAIQEPSPREILQREPLQTGETGGQRGRVEQGQQGNEAPGTVSPGNEVRQGAVQEPLARSTPATRLADVKEPAVSGAVEVPASHDLNDWVEAAHPKEAAGARYLSPDVQYRFHQKVWEAAGRPKIEGESAQTEAAPPPSREQRLNDAGSDLKPVSALTPAEALAELTAAGIKKTPKGIAVEDANSPQLKDAVGKLRRGELTAEGERPNTTEPRKSDRIIAALEKAKIRKPGQISSAVEPFSVAYDAALDVAILGIRAGRALSEVIQMAVAKYRAMHPRATDADVTKLTDAITKASGELYDIPRTEAEQLMASAPPFEAVAGRPKTATKEAAARRGAIAGSEAEQWADRVLAEGRQASGLDPEQLAAHTIKLAAQLEKGAVDFAQWSAEKIKEVGEAIKPHLQRIWDEAHAQLKKFPNPVQSGAAEFRGRSSSSLLEYNTVAKSTDAAKLQYADDFVKWHEANGTPDTAINEMRKIQDPSFRSVVAAKLLANEFERSISGNVAERAMTEDRVQRLLGDVAAEKMQAGQALQAQSPVNDVLLPYSGELALRGALKRQQEEQIGRRFPTDVAGKVNEGFKEAGKKAAERIDAPGATSLLSGPIARIKKASDINWRDIFTDLPENQSARKAEIFDRIKADPKIAALPEATQTKLAEAMEQAWESLRNRIFKEDFAKLVPLPTIAKADRIKLEASLPELTKQANLGLLDNTAFQNALSEKYGIEKMDPATAVKLRELGQKAQRTPEGSERNEVFQEIMDTIMQARGVNPWDLAKDLWYRNVMSAPRTALEIGTGGIVQGAARTFLTALDTATALKRPDIALKMTAMFLRDMGTGVILGADLVRTGDRSILPRYTEQFLAKMGRLEKGQSPGGEIESIYRRGGPVAKTLLAGPEMVGRMLTALDYIGGQGVRNQQMIYSALVKGDKASFDAALKQFNARESVKAERQARKELGPQARFAQVLARKREILNEGIDLEIQKFGNNMTEVTALNAVPVGLSGAIYRAAISRLPMWVKAPGGLAFAKAGLNLFQEYSNWMPLTGQINAARALWRDPSPTNPFRHLALDKVPPERARQIIAAQAVGLALTGATAYKFLSKQPEDGKKQREWEISGSWAGLTPAQKSALLSAGEKQYAVKTPSGRWIDYKLSPLVGALASVGNMRDQQRFNGKKWDDKSITTQVTNSWLMGLSSLKDLSVSSQAATLAGLFSTDTRQVDEKTVEKNVADAIGGAAAGLIPMNSLLREVDNYFDQQRYRPDKNNPGADMWMKQVPFVRRLVGQGAGGTSHPMLNFLGEPVKVVVTPYNRHIGEPPSLNPVEAALSDKVSLGMKIPALSEDTTIVDKGGAMRPMTADENYFYQKSVRQGFATQLAHDLPVFTSATPEQAALYAQEVFTAKERYARNRMNLGVPFDGKIPADPKLTDAASPAYQRAKELNESEAAPSAVEQARLQVAHDNYTAMSQPERDRALTKLANEDPEFAIKLLKYNVSPARNRTALGRAEAQLGPESRAQFIEEQKAGMTPQQRQQYDISQIIDRQITPKVAKESAELRQKKAK